MKGSESVHPKLQVHGEGLLEELPSLIRPGQRQLGDAEQHERAHRLGPTRSGAGIEHTNQKAGRGVRIQILDLTS